MKIKKIYAIFNFKIIGININKMVLLIVFSSLIIYLKATEYGLTFDHSFFELLAFSFANNINLIFVHTLIILILVNKILIIRKEELHFIIRMNNRISLYVINAINIILTSFFWIIANIISSIIMSCNHRIFSQQVGALLSNSLENITSTPNKSILKHFFLLNTNIFLYFICVGLCYYMFYLLIKNEILSLLVTFSLILCNYMIHLSKLEELYQFLPVSNVSYQFLNDTYRVNFRYWGLVLLLVVVLGVFLLRKFNFYGNNKK
jgi:hypothetical protein